MAILYYKDEYVKLINGDCLEIMQKIPDGKIDMILCDLPYGRTKNRWDIIIPFDLLWESYNRIIKPNGAICLFADGMFMAKLMLSNEKMWKYNIVWDKVLTSGFLNANKQPLRQHEEVVVFYKKQPIYNPQKTKGKPNHSQGKPKKNTNNNYNERGFVDNKDVLGDMKHPTSIKTYSKPHPSIMKHPTEKPIEFCEDLIKTYTNEGDLILDNTCGSSTTLVACQNLNRKGLGIELEEKYCEVSKDRLQDNYNKIINIQ